MKIFVGYDTREDMAYLACKHSIILSPRQMYVPKQQELRDAGWYTRPWTNLLPGIYFYKILFELTNFEGWAVSWIAI